MSMMLELSTLQIRKDIVESLCFLWDFRKKTSFSWIRYYFYRPKKNHNIPYNSGRQVAPSISGYVATIIMQCTVTCIYYWHAILAFLC